MSSDFFLLHITPSGTISSFISVKSHWLILWRFIALPNSRTWNSSLVFLSKNFEWGSHVQDNYFSISALKPLNIISWYSHWKIWSRQPRRLWPLLDVSVLLSAELPTSCRQLPSRFSSWVGVFEWDGGKRSCQWKHLFFLPELRPIIC